NCNNGEIIQASYYCDQVVDCSDGSDENNCGGTTGGGGGGGRPDMAQAGGPDAGNAEAALAAVSAAL
ncbi:MAG: hypothetical protein ACPIEU_07540, partial [Candidatus Puniceispirillaceae bacterium]